MMTRDEMYDWLRRQLGIVPPIDDGIPGARPGDTPPARPLPSNQALKQAIDNAVWKVNRDAQLCQMDPSLEVVIPAKDTPGPATVTLKELPRPNVSRVLSAWWKDSTDTVRRLTPFGSGEMERAKHNWVDAPPSTPIIFWVEAGTISIHPAPSSAGKLLLQVEFAVMPPQFDEDIFSTIPKELETAILYQALVELGKSYLGDAEMQARAAAFQEDAINGLAAIKAWAARQVGRYQPRLSFRSYRTGRIYR